MKVAVIGAGTMGGMHAQLLGGLDGVDQVLVVDMDAARADAVARNAGGQAVTQDEAFDRADAIVIATPAGLHAPAVEAAIARGIPALCEKPLTDDLASSRALVAHVEAEGSHVEMGFQRRHDPGFGAARARVAEAAAGRIHLIRLTAFDPRTTPRPLDELTPHESAPIFLHSSVHDFDFVRWMSGDEVVEVTAEGSGRGDGRPADPRGIETAVVTMRLRSGGLAVLEATWLHPTGYDIRAEVLADGAHVVAGLSPRTPAEAPDWPSMTPAQRWSGYLERFEPAYRAELVAFLAAARGEARPASTARDGYEALRIAVAATRAYDERRTVALSEI